LKPGLCLPKGVDFEFPGDKKNNIPVVPKTLEKVHSTYTPSDFDFYLYRFFNRSEILRIVEDLFLENFGSVSLI